LKHFQFDFSKLVFCPSNACISHIPQFTTRNLVRGHAIKQLPRTSPEIHLILITLKDRKKLTFELLNSRYKLALLTHDDMCLFPVNGKYLLCTEV